MKLSSSNSVLERIGNTPTVSLSVEDDSVPILVKMEAYNPGGSIKDRVAMSIISQARRAGSLKQGMEIVESTSGNTGIGLALIGKAMGHSVTIITHDKISAEKAAVLKHFGAKVKLCDSTILPHDDGGYISYGKRYAKENNAFFCDQFANTHNIDAHYRGTAPELWDQGGKDCDFIVCGVGSGGTLLGMQKFFKKKCSNAKFVVADPLGSIYKHYFTQCDYHPSCFCIEGIGSNFIPSILRGAQVDEVIQVKDSEAIKACNTLRNEHSLDFGLSSGVIISAALEVKKNYPNSKIACVSPDSGERYMSKFNL